jgi:hypothetical protein
MGKLFGLPTQIRVEPHKLRPWAMIDVDTTLKMPKLTVRFFELEAPTSTHEIKLSDLSHK